MSGLPPTAVSTSVSETINEEREREGRRDREGEGGGEESVYEIQVCGIVIIMTLEFFSCKSGRKILSHIGPHYDYDHKFLSSKELPSTVTPSN